MTTTQSPQVKKGRIAMKTYKTLLILALVLAPAAGCSSDDTTTNPDVEPASGDGSYAIVDTGLTDSYGNAAAIATPAEGEDFYGQDAQYVGNQPDYLDNGDGTVNDLVTGLMWQQDPGDKMTLAQAEATIGSFGLAGYDDWRIPTIKELYSLILFTGTDPSGMEGDDTSGLTPFMDDVFVFEYGDPATERIIDSQYLTSTIYVSTTMNGDVTVFGVNFADGRIKGYPVTDPMTQSGKTFFALFVRGGDDYGVNDYVDNGDGTITDLATGLMWMKQDSGHLGAGDAGDGGLDWEQALAWSESLDYADYSDWRLPDVKELQSLLDYTRSPATDGTPAIDPVFETTPITVEDGSSDFPFYWSGTSHVNYLGGSSGSYVAFGTGYGWMQGPFGGDYNFWDVHGAGCQRSDPKSGDPADYPYGHGPQGDVIRIYNHVRCVRTATEVSSLEVPSRPDVFLTTAPNPFNPLTTLSFEVPIAGRALVEIFDLAGRRLASLVDCVMSAGSHQVAWDGSAADGRGLPSGVYLARLSTAGVDVTTKIAMTR
jgi:hypothetical protein